MKTRQGRTVLVSDATLGLYHLLPFSAYWEEKDSIDSEQHGEGKVTDEI